jgi:hypothetical protein
MNRFFNYLIVAVILLISALAFVTERLVKANSERERLEGNLTNVTAERIRELSLSKAEYNRLNTDWKVKLDSVLAANEIKLKEVKSAVIIRTVYRDTGSVKIIYRDVIRMPDNSFRIPVSFDNGCWSMAGTISSFDIGSKLDITQRGGKNSVERIEIKPKRFLGFLWITKGGEVKAFSDYGEVDVTKIDFIK